MVVEVVEFDVAEDPCPDAGGVDDLGAAGGEDVHQEVREQERGQVIDLQSLLKPVFGDLPHTHDAAGVVGEHINTWAHGPQPLGQRADLVQPGEVGAQVGSVQSAGALRRLGFGAADEDQAVALAGELARRGGADAVAGSGDDYGALGHGLTTPYQAWVPVDARPPFQ